MANAVRVTCKKVPFSEGTVFGTVVHSNVPEAARGLGPVLGNDRLFEKLLELRDDF